MTSNSSLPRLGVIGGGHLGRIHAKLAAINPLCSFVGVADPSADARALIASQLNLPAVENYQSWEGHVDAVIVAAPTFLHHQIGSWCLNRGIPVFMEKPIASTLEEASQLAHLARSNDLCLQIGHVERFNPAWRLACHETASESIRYIEAAREGTYTGRSTDIGIVMDLMIHDIDLVLSAVNSPIEDVHAYGWNVLGEHEDFATACVTFKDGTIAQLRASRVSASPRRCMQIYTDESLTEVDFGTGSVVRTRAFPDVADGSRQADKLPPELRAKVKDSLYVDWLSKQEMKAEAANAIESEHNEFLQAVRFRTPITVNGTHGCQALALATRVLEQIAINKPSRAIIPAAFRFGQPKAA